MPDCEPFYSIADCEYRARRAAAARTKFSGVMAVLAVKVVPSAGRRGD
jgi:hypothetical protein